MSCDNIGLPAIPAPSSTPTPTIVAGAAANSPPTHGGKTPKSMQAEPIQPSGTEGKYARRLLEVWANCVVVGRGSWFFLIMKPASPKPDLASADLGPVL